VGRAQDLRYLAEAAGRGDCGATVLIEGGPGMGRTALLAAFAARQQADGVRVLTARTRPAGTDLGQDLFIQRAGFDGERTLVAVDDVQWADAASLRRLAALSDLAERLPLVLALTVRDREAGCAPRLLMDLVGRPDVRRIRLAPLGVGAVAELAEAVFGRPVDRAFAAACHEASGGCPLVLTALLDTMAERGLTPVADARASIREAIAPAQATVLRRYLASLPDDRAAVVRALATLDVDVEAGLLAHVARADERTVSKVLAALRGLRLLRPEPSAAFASAEVRAAVLDMSAATEITDDEVRIARSLADDGAPAQCVAAHLMAVQVVGEPWAGVHLREAAAEAVARGEPGAAGDYLRRALREPLRVHDRIETLMSLAQADVVADPRLAYRRLREAEQLSEDAWTAAEIALRAAQVLMRIGDSPAAVATVDRALYALPAPAQVSGAGRDLVLRLLALRLMAKPQDAVEFAAARRLDELLPTVEATSRGGAELLVMAAVTAAGQTRPAGEVMDIVRRVLVPSVWRADADDSVLAYLGMLLVAADEMDLAREFFGRLMDQQHAHLAARYSLAGSVWAQATYRRGELREAIAETHLVLDHSPRPSNAAALSTALLIDAYLMSGDVAAASSLVDLLPASAAIGPWARAALLSSRARTLAELGEPQAALEQLLALGQHMQDERIDNPGVIPWRFLAAQAYDALGETAAARSLLEQEIALDERWGTPLCHGISLLGAGMLDGPGSRDALRAAVAQLEQSQAPLALATACAFLGRAHLAGGDHQAGRDAAQRGFDLATQCGADQIAELSRSVLRQAGVRPRRPRTGALGLTPSERRVAAMAVDGLSNKEIAQSLVVTQRTVEIHLSRVYRKLGIAARTELTREHVAESSQRA
jgi:DNA-binding CsgD family transcriptional regulator